MFAAVARWPKQRWPWVLLSFSALTLLLVALYFQYGMSLGPCTKCVYQRFAIVGILLAGLVGLWGRESALLRWSAYIGWAVAAGWGLKIAHDQVLVEEAKARLEAEKLNAAAEIERAKGMAEAMKVENGTLSATYNQYLFIRTLEKLADKGSLPQIIYVPSEGLTPVMDLNKTLPKK